MTSVTLTKPQQALLAKLKDGYTIVHTGWANDNDKDEIRGGWLYTHKPYPIGLVKVNPLVVRELNHKGLLRLVSDTETKRTYTFQEPETGGIQ